VAERSPKGGYVTGDKPYGQLPTVGDRHGAGAQQLPDFGQVAYEAYTTAVGGVSVQGDLLPTWEELGYRNGKVADAWTEAGLAVARLFAGAAG
jgi:hypothetical protein